MNIQLTHRVMWAIPRVPAGTLRPPCTEHKVLLVSTGLDHGSK